MPKIVKTEIARNWLLQYWDHRHHSHFERPSLHFRQSGNLKKIIKKVSFWWGSIIITLYDYMEQIKIKTFLVRNVTVTTSINLKLFEEISIIKDICRENNFFPQPFIYLYCIIKEVFWWFISQYKTKIAFLPT